MGGIAAAASAVSVAHTVPADNAAAGARAGAVATEHTAGAAAIAARADMERIPRLAQLLAALTLMRDVAALAAAEALLQQLAPHPPSHAAANGASVAAAAYASFDGVARPLQLRRQDPADNAGAERQQAAAAAAALLLPAFVMRCGGSGGISAERWACLAAVPGAAAVLRRALAAVRAEQAAVRVEEARQAARTVRRQGTGVDVRSAALSRGAASPPAASRSGAAESPAARARAREEAEAGALERAAGLAAEEAAAPLLASVPAHLQQCAAALRARKASAMLLWQLALPLAEEAQQHAMLKAAAGEMLVLVVTLHCACTHANDPIYPTFFLCAHPLYQAFRSASAGGLAPTRGWMRAGQTWARSRFASRFLPFSLIALPR